MNYWLGRGGQKLGPYTLEDLRRMVAEGSAVASDLVWHEGLPAWVPLPQVIPLPITPILPPAPLAVSPSIAPPAGWTPPPSANTGIPYAAPYQAPVPVAPPAITVAPVPGLMPPDLHWALVLLFGYLTLGVFPIVWFFIQANFARKLNPADRSLLLGILGTAAPIIGLFMLGVSAAMSVASLSDGPLPFAMVGAGILFLATPVLMLIAIFGMKSTLENHYNRIEPIGLRLSGVMTFFFSLYYFQHHLSRIAQWKKTGYLQPQ